MGEIMDIMQGLITLLVVYFILTSAYATLLPSATAITIVGINFAFVITVGVIIVVLSYLRKLGKGWK
jgi:hypothetical protein